MREFCSDRTCDGQVEIPDDVRDGDEVECQKCGKRYEYKMNFWLVPLEPYEEK